jgi:hypothetical protein
MCPTGGRKRAEEGERNGTLRMFKIRDVDKPAMECVGSEMEFGRQCQVTGHIERRWDPN